MHIHRAIILGGKCLESKTGQVLIKPGYVGHLSHHTSIEETRVMSGHVYAHQATASTSIRFVAIG